MSIQWPPTSSDLLPGDPDAVLIGRAMTSQGPSVVVVRDDLAIDITQTVATVRDLAEHPDPVGIVMASKGRVLGKLDELAANTPWEQRDPDQPWLLSPVDLQAVKAAGVTFAVSMVERVIEERCGGDATRAAELRAEITDLVGEDLSAVRPGSPETARLKALLSEQNAWSQYLEVGLGPDAEIFTKTTPLASVGGATDVGLHPGSSWNNPEPELALLIDSRGRTIGATLGNDVNLRDFEGRSALLLSKAKDNNASAALGSFIRLFDDQFGLDDIRRAEVTLRVEGTDGFRLDGSSSMTQISRDPIDLIDQLMGAHHQYPDGVVFYLGTMFAPVKDRGEPGQGFTHHDDDLVAISAPELGALVNRVRRSTACEPWTWGAAALFGSLVRRGAPVASPMP